MYYLHDSGCPRNKDVVDCCSLPLDASAIFVDYNCDDGNWWPIVSMWSSLQRNIVSFGKWSCPIQSIWYSVCQDMQFVHVLLLSIVVRYPDVVPKPFRVSPWHWNRPAIAIDMDNFRASKQSRGSIYGKTFCHHISQNLGAARYRFSVVRLLWHLTDVSATVLPRRLSNSRVIRSNRIA